MTTWFTSISISSLFLVAHILKGCLFALKNAIVGQIFDASLFNADQIPAILLCHLLAKLRIGDRVTVFFLFFGLAHVVTLALGIRLTDAIALR
jgi:hypothetical protein